MGVNTAMLRRVRHNAQGWIGCEVAAGPLGIVSVMADRGAVPRWLHSDELVDEMDRTDWQLIADGLTNLTPKTGDQGRRLHRLIDWAVANREDTPDRLTEQADAAARSERDRLFPLDARD